MIGALDQFRTARTGQEVALGMIGMAHTDVAVRIDYCFVGEDSVGDHELADVEVQIVHGLFIQRGIDIDQMRHQLLPYPFLRRLSNARRSGKRACFPPNTAVVPDNPPSPHLPLFEELALLPMF